MRGGGGGEWMGGREDMYIMHPGRFLTTRYTTRGGRGPWMVVGTVSGFPASLVFLLYERRMEGRLVPLTPVGPLGERKKKEKRATGACVSPSNGT
jgi:hypothetical protein